MICKRLTSCPCRNAVKRLQPWQPGSKSEHGVRTECSYLTSVDARGRRALRGTCAYPLFWPAASHISQRLPRYSLDQCATQHPRAHYICYTDVAEVYRLP